MDREAWHAAFRGVAELGTTEWLNSTQSTCVRPVLSRNYSSSPQHLWHQKPGVEDNFSTAGGERRMVHTGVVSLLRSMQPGSLAGTVDSKV